MDRKKEKYHGALQLTACKYAVRLYVRRDAFAATENDIWQLVGFLLLLQQMNCVQRSVGRAH